MIEHLNSISLKKLVDDQVVKGVSIEVQPVKRAMFSSQPVVKPIRITTPNSVFALGNSFSSK
jgi:Rrf2 family iron-sulfur cluster assembly transcriptional regulator